MKYFLKKRDNEFWLESRSENHCTVIAEQEPNVNDLTSKLSIKNCQAIERGWDLDELVEQEFSKFDQEVRIIYRRQLQESLANMFKKALEILGDKKFSEDDVIKCMKDSYGLKYFSEQKMVDNLKSLQPTEWEVEVEIYEEKEFIFDPAMGISQGHYLDKPKLDADGCLILKKK